jgi:hypothetical protein
MPPPDPACPGARARRLSRTQADRETHSDQGNNFSHGRYPERNTHAPSDDHGQLSHRLRLPEVRRLAVIATLSKGYDLDYIWKQVDPSLAKNAAGYYIQASEAGGEPPGRWWGQGAKALGLDSGEVVDREPYELLFGERKAPTAPRWAGPRATAGRPPTSMPSSWPPSRTPPLSASASCAVLAEVAKAWQAAGLGPVVGITAYQSARNTLAAGVPVSYNSAQIPATCPAGAAPATPSRWNRGRCW